LQLKVSRTAVVFESICKIATYISGVCRFPMSTQYFRTGYQTVKLVTKLFDVYVTKDGKFVRAAAGE